MVTINSWYIIIKWVCESVFMKLQLVFILKALITVIFQFLTCRKQCSECSQFGESDGNKSTQNRATRGAEFFAI